MLQLRSILNIADNTGAKQIRLIGIPGKGNAKYAYIGDIVTGSVISAQPNGEVKKGELVHALVVRTRKEKGRADGSYVRFDDNAAVVLQGVKSKDPKGTRFFGPLAREVKDLGYGKIASMASEIY
ncbi:MAG: 50S ribosomal protein L14 [Candidatus Paceibacterota bacterium]